MNSAAPDPSLKPDMLISGLLRISAVFARQNDELRYMHNAYMGEFNALETLYKKSKIPLEEYQEKTEDLLLAQKVAYEENFYRHKMTHTPVQLNPANNSARVSAQMMFNLINEVFVYVPILDKAREVLRKTGAPPSVKDNTLIKNFEYMGKSDWSWRRLDRALKKGLFGVPLYEGGLPQLLKDKNLDGKNFHGHGPIIEMGKRILDETGFSPCEQDTSIIPDFDYAGKSDWSPRSLHRALIKGWFGLIPYKGGLIQMLKDNNIYKYNPAINNARRANTNENPAISFG